MARFGSWLLFICSVLAVRGSRVLVHLQEMCQDEALDENGFMQFLARKSEILPDGVELEFLRRDEVCNGGSGLRALLAALGAPGTRALVASVPHDACSLLARAARLYGIPLLSWTCPQTRKVEACPSVVPSLEQAGGAVVAAVQVLKCKNAIIISEDTSPWSILANKVKSGLVKIGVTSRRFLWDSTFEPEDKLAFVHRIKNTNIRAMIICSPYNSAVTVSILKAFDKHDFHPSVTLITDMYSLISTTTTLQNHNKQTTRQLLEIHSLKLKSTIIKSSSPNVYLRDNSHNHSVLLKNKYNTENNSSAGDLLLSESFMSKTFPSVNNKNITRSSTFLLPQNITKVSRTIGTKKEVIKNNEQTSDSKPMGMNISDPDPQTMSSRGHTTRNSATKAETIAGSKHEQNNVDKKQTSTQAPSDDSKQYEAFESFQTVGTKEKVRFDNKQNANAKTIDAINVGESGNFHQVNFARAKKKRKLTDKDNKLFRRLRPNDTVTNFNTRTEVRDNGYRRVKKSAHTSSLSNDLSLSNVSSQLYNSIWIMKGVNNNKGNELRDEVFEYVFDSLMSVRNNCKSSVNDFHYFFYGLFPPDGKHMDLLQWELLLIIQEYYNTSSEIGNISHNITIVKKWLMGKESGIEEDECEGSFCLSGSVSVTTAHIIAILAGSLAVSTVIAAFGMTMRNVLMRNRLSKGPNKIVLLANDFVFPQVADSRRVDEGMEAMLCCWLQQLQEFGGPEVEKPDLLKGSLGSLRGLGVPGHPGSATKGPSSNGSISKSNHHADIRTKYNGDLVQMKYIPNVGTFELKSKATDILVVMHGLRHENINPFIGCLCEPSKPALVFEYCSRGSLEDVLIADEIKLDWTFRLSLLTDLVRGMRYLHGSGGAVRAHGRLSSRSCVVDARWVLKVTDYGLPAFYDAQGVPPAAINHRDLLWTAPELLRAECSVRGRGSAAGDVYSFAIIMQEVVVRGEPFCMLALTPEEIIEKIKKPPPLIRPSVSKGAAPPEAINIMRQCWTEQPDMRPDFNTVHDLFRKLNHGRKVNFIDTMFQMLEKYSNNLEDLIRERTEQLDMEKKKTEQLLNRMLPSSVADKLKLGMPVDPEAFSDVSIYFSDIVGFTAISANSSPLQVVDLLNDLYTCFDATINAYNVYKVETIGDAYMVVGGLPVRASDHAEQIATMALDLLHHSSRFRIRHLPATPLHLRIGLHTGPCCAGVIGLTMPRYCLFGDTVNTASRMESTGAAWRIHLSQTTRDKLEAAGGYQLEYRGPTEIKGKGRMHTYWLLGKHGFDKPLPTPPPLGDNQSLEDLLIAEEGTLSVSHSLRHSQDRSSDTASGEELSPRAGTSGLCAERDRSSLTSPDSQSDKPGHHLFSIDRSFFNVETQSTQQVIEQRKMNHQIRQDGRKDGSTPNEFLQNKVFSPDNSQHTPLIETEQKHGAENEYSDTVQQELVSKQSLDTIPSYQKQSLGLSLGIPVSASEVAAALLGASTTSLGCSQYRDVTRFKRSAVMDETDLSTPYNHYRCLSPSESNLTHAGKCLSLSLDAKPGSGRFLKRQFSLDRDDSSGAENGNSSRRQPRLFRQNSAGAANDLERIEEIPLRINSPGPYRHRKLLQSSFPSGSMSVSSESLNDDTLFLSTKGHR